MVDKNKQVVDGQVEKVLDFETAKDLTVGEAVQKHKEIVAGVTEEDGLLDRYIKQHRAEIESQKVWSKEEVVAPVATAVETAKETIDQETKQFDLPKESVAAIDPLPVVDASKEEDNFVLGPVEDASTQKKFWIWASLGLAFLATLVSAFIWLNRTSSTNTSSSSSSTTSQTSSATSSSSEDVNLTAFNDLYASFFTDSSLSKLKNSAFDSLSDLKAILDKMDSSSDAYKEAKAKYDSLEKAIEATKAINSQFDKALIVDGELDTTATANSSASFTATATGISSVDATLTAAINFGQSQLENAATVASSSSQAAASSTTNTTASTTASSTSQATTSTAVTNSVSTLYGIAVPEGVTLQRNLSRVPYDQSKINDANNEAWNFNPGILEKIIATSQQRGYISGNNYILEKVNIINGNGYYNLFKPDGTYLFSINCKTGYFVGNGSGHSDALDY
ncbi:cell division site-positioning protein MapZ family protein [Streptococcus suis]|uniref:cell division site-positioning protein MapZ family protein n=1 Tax=Streptococcus suis TaxID=1307 RepID=UPI001ABE8FBE|nr:hypothetical protein [Streptococcus suis]